MTQMDVDTRERAPDPLQPAEDLGQAAPGPGRFACPSCGSMLRTGAILCPRCDADLWTMAHGGPAPPREAASEAASDPTARALGTGDGRLGRHSLMLAVAAVGTNLLLPVLAAAVGELSWLWSLLGWATTLMAVSAVHLARKVVGRMSDPRDEGGALAATYGLILGMASLAYVASTFITRSIDHVIGNLRA